MKIKLLVLLSFIFLFIFTQKTYACGCGIAITNMKVFNALKETQAYLLIDVKDQNTYDEMPFFRFISMDRPYDVTIVFPIDQIPYDVKGEKISAGEFLNKYDISEAESFIKKQDAVELAKNINNIAFLGANGIVPLFTIALFSFSAGFGAAPGATGGRLSPIAHFEFEGGTLDIYDVSSAQTLDEFVKTLDIEVTDKVEELVTKYKDYYVAVLKIKVPSLISEDKITYLENCAPQALEVIKNELSQKSEVSFYELMNMAMRAPNSCGGQEQVYLEEYISSATYQSDQVNGTLVIMKFKNNNNFFYPTSIVNSYKYPIKDQKYYVKVPDNLNIELSSSSISKIANFNNQRWYKIESTQEDLKGKIVESNYFVSLGDANRNLVMKLNENSWSLILLTYILILIAPLVIFKKSEKITLKEIGLTIVAYLIGGLILSSILSFVKKKRKVAFTYIAIWFVMGIIFSLTYSL